MQDPAARLVSLIAGVQPGQKVLDLCAAPGGKSFAAAMQMRDQGCMISCDIHENKWKRIRAGAERLGLACISTRTMDARRPDADLTGAIDIVLADVPCSGLGVIRKKPEIRFKDPAELERLPGIQRDILAGLAPCVKPGGVLVINSSIIDRKAVRDDITVVYCDANGIAESVGNPKGANVAILGALMEKAPVVSNEILGEAIRIELGERKAKFLEGNMKALEAGEAAARG